MAKKTPMTDFFPSARREIKLNKYELLEVVIDGEDRKRSKLNVSIPISSSRAVVGMPSWISNPLAEMGKDESLSNRTAVEAICKGMTMEIFSTEKIRHRAHMSTGVVATAFALVATGVGEKRDINLDAVIYVPGNIEIHQWAWDHIHKTFWAQFEYSQTEIDFDGDEDNDEEKQTAAGNEELDGDDEYSAPAVAARAKGKRGDNADTSVN